MRGKSINRTFFDFASSRIVNLTDLHSYEIQVRVKIATQGSQLSRAFELSLNFVFERQMASRATSHAALSNGGWNTMRVGRRTNRTPKTPSCSEGVRD